MAASSAAGVVRAGTVTTVAGGPGRGRVRNVSIQAEAVTPGPGGAIYVGDQGDVVRRFTDTSALMEVTAGIGVPSFKSSGDGGLAARARLGGVFGVAVDHAGNVVIADSNNRVRVVAASSGTFYGKAMRAGDIYTIAGTGTAGYSGDGGPAAAAKLSLPWSVAVDAAGNVIVGDARNFRVRVVAARSGGFYGHAMKAGDIYTVAGDGTQGFAGDGGLATAAELNFHLGVALDAAGNLVITDTANNRVRVVAARAGSFYGQAMKTGHIYTVAGNGGQGFAGDGGPASAAELNFLDSAAVDGAGNLVISDTVNNRVRVVAATSGTFYGKAMTAGDIYTVAGNGSFRDTGNGGPATSAGVGNPAGVTVDHSGNLVIAEGTHVRVVAARSGRFYRRAMKAGDIYIAAGNGQLSSSGNGGRAVDAEMLNPGGIALTGPGDPGSAEGYLIGDRSQVRMVATTTGTFFGQAMTAGDIYGVAGHGRAGYSGDGGPATTARLNGPGGTAFDPAGNMVISDSQNNRIRVVAATSGTFYTKPMTAGDIYTVAGNGKNGYSGDGGLATAAKLSLPGGVTVDDAGNLVIADVDNDRVRVVAATSGTFYGRPMTAGDIYTVAGNGTAGFAGDGGPATAAELWGPFETVFDTADNLLIADGSNNRIRVVAATSGRFYGQRMTAGDIYTIAGNGTAGFAGDGGPANGAELNVPQWVTPDAAGNLLIADTVNDRVRVAAATSGTFYGQAMTAGDIYTVAGNGKDGFSGDGGPATAAKLSRPTAVAVDASGDLLVVDSFNGRVRMIHE